AVYQDAGRFAEARRSFEDGLAVAARVADANIVLDLEGNLASTLEELDDLEGSAALLERCRARALDLLGPDHPKLAGILYNLGGGRALQSRYDEAIASHREALRVCELAFGADHRNCGFVRNLLGNDEKQTGRLDEALDEYTRALAIKERTGGPDNPDLVTTL